MELILKRHISPQDKQRSDYAYVPFDLPEAARSITVHYRYSAPIGSDETEGGNVIDIGLFDPRGMEFPGGEGFRGWSGSARSTFTISATCATPGYLAGPLPPGRYHVILGLYRIWPDGADYEIEIAVDIGADARPIDAASAPNAQTAIKSSPDISSRGGNVRWLRGDLQSHSNHSDAAGTLDQLLNEAQTLGLDFLAITDHNTVSHHAHLASVESDKTLLLRGQEVTAYNGHLNVWGTGRWCDFRCRSDEDMAAVIELAHSSGGLCSINHPKIGGPAWEFGLDLPIDAVEVWQGPWPWRNEESLALWERLLLSGRRLTAVGGSDYHCVAGDESSLLQLGLPATWVKSNGCSALHVLDAIRAGRVSISAFPVGPRLDISATGGAVTVGMGEELPVTSGEPFELTATIENGVGWVLRCIADGTVAHEIPVTAYPQQMCVPICADTYVRAELVGDAPPEIVPDNVPIPIDLREWRWALTNPIYIKAAQKENQSDH